MRGIPFCFLLPSKYCSQIYVVNTFIILLLPILTLLDGCQEEKLSDEVMVWLCLERGAYCLHMVQLMPLPSQNPIISCLILSRLVLSFLYRLTQVALEMRPLNGCCSGCSCLFWSLDESSDQYHITLFVQICEYISKLLLFVFCKLL